MNGNLSNTLHHIGSNLKLGYKLLAARKIDNYSVHVSTGVFIGLVLIVMLVELLTAWLITSEPATFNAYGVSYLASTYLFDGVFLALILLLARQNISNYGVLVTAYLSTIPVFIIFAASYEPISELTNNAVWFQWTFFAIILSWLFYIVFKIISFLPYTSKSSHLIHTSIFVTLGLAVSLLLPTQEIFYTDTSNDSSDSYYQKFYNLDVEAIFYSQHKLLKNNIDTLHKHTPGKSDLYLITFAGDAHEDVFLKEAKYVQEIFDENLGTTNRSLIMANNLTTVNQLPLANYHNLKLGLEGISKIINVEEDIVFLFMTSHGNEKHRFSLRFGSVKMNNISPEDVKRAFDESGIRWRVILVSSCYSGGFIESLKDKNTLIITAAAKDKQSFGCGVESEFTEFGNAYFKQGLKQDSDFIKAFYTAKEWVKKKETEDKRKSSDPQIYIGESITTKLEELEL